MLDLQYFYYSVAIISIGVLFDTIHSLYFYQKYYSIKGLFSLNIIYDKNDKSSFSKIMYYLYPLMNEKVFYIFLWIRLIISMLLICFPTTFNSLIIIIFLLQLLFNIRNKLSLSGADQMRTILLFGLSVISFNTEDYYSIGLLFIILQMYISYFFTGYNKLKSPSWKKGNGLILVMNNDLFGNNLLQTFLINRGKTFNQVLCWGIILFQLLFPLFASVEVTVIYILFIGIIFHLFLAVISNLNDFFWTYTSAYPLIYIFATKLSIYAFLFI